MHSIEITEIKKLTELIKDSHGYDFTDYAMSSFKRRVSRVLDLYNLTSVNTLIDRIRMKPEIVEEVVNEITVNVTEMFRDPSFWREVRDHIIPNILLNHKNINVWHAGCSSGEEVFSMAILLKEMGIDHKVNLIATDLDNSILNKARRATIPVKNMELNEKNYIRFQGSEKLSNYYTEENGKAILDPSLIANISFRKHDLVQGAIFNKFDLVLCRNVMIYFNQNLQNEVLKKLHGSLFKYGYLIIGSKESLIWCEVSNKFIVVNNEEKIYKKIKD